MNGEKTIFIDCFDTIIFRTEHPLLFLKRWAVAVCKLYPSLDADALYRARREAGKKYQLIDEILNDVYSELNMFVDKEQFLRDTHRLEVETEASVHYTSKKVKKSAF